MTNRLAGEEFDCLWDSIVASNMVRKVGQKEGNPKAPRRTKSRGVNSTTCEDGYPSRRRPGGEGEKKYREGKAGGVVGKKEGLKRRKREKRRKKDKGRVLVQRKTVNVI